MSEVMGSSTYVEHKQPILRDIGACQAYFVIRSCIDLGLKPRAKDADDGVATDVLVDVVTISPFASPYSDEISSMFGMKEVQKAHDLLNCGLIVYRNSSGSRFTDSLEHLLRMASGRCKDPLWWVIPLMRSEIFRCRASLAKFSRSKILLPIGSGSKCEVLCLIGHKDHPQSVEVWDEVTNSKLGWYNSCVRTMRVAPDICRDCWMILKYFNPRVS